ncbi:MAG: hypothetical protein RL030_161 [Pseudomonadota bacterium]
MRALLDVNVLAALLDAGHIHHATANHWLGSRIDAGWASSPLTQIGCLRLLSLPTYPRPQPLAAVAARLREATRTPHHEFWSDEPSVLDESVIEPRWLLSSRQVSDACLLALAVRHEGVFVTFDGGVDIRMVQGAEARHLALI